MKCVSKLSLLAGAALGAFALPILAHAADAPSVQELVVTAEKREQNLRDVPQSVTALGGEALQEKRLATFEDYIATVPGMNLIQAQPGQGRLVLRGINAGGVSATIGTYVDETPYGSVTGLANGAVLAPDIDAFDMQRIEVLRGPQGTLYGASSLGGLLKFVTAPPDPSHMSGRLDFSVDNTESSTTGGSVKGVFNMPLGQTMAVRGNGYWDNSPGFIDDPLRHARNVNGTSYTGGRISFLARPNDKLSIRLTAATQAISNKGTSTEDVNRVTLAPLYGDLTQSRTFSPTNRINYDIYNATIDYDLGFASLTSATSWGKLHQDNLQDGSPIYGALLTLIFKQPLGASLQQNLNQEKFTQEVRLASGKQQFEWLVGGFFTREHNDLIQSLNGISLASPPQVPAGLGGLIAINLESSYAEYAGFANVDYHFNDRFDISAGGRYSHNDQNENQLTKGLLAGPASLIVGASSEDVFTFAVAPKYKLNDDTTIYARIAKGYRPGGPNAVNPLAPPIVPRTFASDSTMNYEIGIKGDVGRDITYDLTAFYIDWSKIQLLANVSNFGVNTNGGSAESKGVEGSVVWAATHELTLSANGAYVEANLTENTPALLGGKSGDRLPFSSPFTGSLNADYTHLVPGGAGAMGDMRVFAGGTVQFTGRRRSDFNATFGQTSLPSYTALDLRAGIEVRGYRVTLYAKNVTDERGILSFAAPGGAPAGAAQLGLMRPRSVGVALSASF
jgi:outer membrane receptor protein involved in Fe transport